MTENLTQMLVNSAKERPTLRVGTVDDQMLLSEALEIAAGGAAWIDQYQPNTGGRVAIVAGSSTDYLLVWMACLLAARPVALINPTYPAELLTQMLANLDPALVLTDREDRDFTNGLPVFPISACRDWDKAQPSDCAGISADGLDVASFMHTSGTTGVPKFCAQSHTYFLRLGRAIADAMQLESGDRVLAPLPLFHVNPLGYGIIGGILAGADALALPRFSASQFWPTIREHQITAMILHAPPVEILKRSTTAQDAAGHKVRTMFFADGEFMRRFGIARSVGGYGSTEAGGMANLHPWRLGDDIPQDASGRGGPSRPDFENMIDQGGQIHVRERVRGAMFSGYFDGGAVVPATDSEGWFATGDRGTRDEEGNLVFVERFAESIRVKGEYVPIRYVEERLGQISELTDLALWKKPGDLVDDEVVLYIAVDQVPLDEIQRVSGDLPAFMRPSHVARLKAIPRDAAAGKVQRRLLHEQEVLSWTTLP